MADDTVIDIDGHVLMEAADGWLDFFEPAEAREMERLLLQNRKHWYSREGLSHEALYASIRERVKGAGGWDPKARIHSIGGIRSLAFSTDSTQLAVGGTGKINNIDHLEALARVEIGLDEMSKVSRQEIQKNIEQGLFNVGYQHVIIDPQGYRMGSLNKGINLRPI